MDRKFKGIVIKEKPSGEKGKLLYILTESEGVVQVTATGARSISASYLKSVQLFAYSELSVYEKNGRMTLTEATLLESIYGIRSDLSSFAVSSYMAELCFLVSTAQNDGVLSLFLNCLYALSKSLAESRMVKAVFEYRLCLIDEKRRTGLPCMLLSVEPQPVDRAVLTDGLFHKDIDKLFENSYKPYETP